MSDRNLLASDSDIQDEIPSLSQIEEVSCASDEDQKHPNSANSQKRHREITLDMIDDKMEIEEITPKAPQKIEFSLNTINEEDSFMAQDSLIENGCQTSYISSRTDKINSLKQQLKTARDQIANEPSKHKSILA